MGKKNKNKGQAGEKPAGAADQSQQGQQQPPQPQPAAERGSQPPQPSGQAGQQQRQPQHQGPQGGAGRGPPSQQGGGDGSWRQQQQRGPQQAQTTQKGQQKSQQPSSGAESQQGQQQQNKPQQQGGGTWSKQGQQHQRQSQQLQQPSGGAWSQQGQKQPQQQGGGTWSQQGKQQQRQSQQQGGGAWSQQGQKQQHQPQQQGGGTWSQQGQQQQRQPQQQGGGTWSQQGQKQQRQPQQQGGGTWSQPGQQQQRQSQQQGGGGAWSQQGQQQQRQPQQQGGETWSKQGQQQQRGGPGPRAQQQQQGQQQGAVSQTRQSTPYMSHSSSSTSISSAKSMSGIPRGTEGTPRQVEVNYLKINIDKMPDTAYHYDVTFTPDRPKKFLRPAFVQFVNSHLNGVACAFDGNKSFYTVQRLEHDYYEGEVQVADNGGRLLNFKIVAKETDTIEVDLRSLRTYHQERIFDNPRRALQCLEVALANPGHERSVRVGRSFFVKPDRKQDLKDGFELWTGLFQATILGDQPFLNVDIAHKSFPSSGSLIQWLESSTIPLDATVSGWKLKKLEDFLRGMRVEYRPPQSFGATSKLFNVHTVTREGANALSFTLEDGKRTTVADYFRSRKYNLRYPELNCLHLGSSVKANYIPIELCYIPPGQALNKKDASDQVKEIIKYAATSTDIRKRKIEALLRFFAHNSDPIISLFGIGIGAEFIKVPMRILNGPLIEYCRGETIRVQNGSWRMGTNTKFLQPYQAAKQLTWAIIYSRGERGVTIHELENMASMISSAARKLGMCLADRPERINVFNNIETEMKDLKSKNCDIVIVVIPTRGVSYADIKKNAELKYGILTQCIKQFTVQRKIDHQTVLNLLLKINAKLNGSNHKISAQTHVPLQNVMFIGADVTHPSPDQKQIPSVVGVAASHDTNGAQYNMQYRLQEGSKEEIEDMDSIMAYHLQMYKKYQNRYPEHVIYYRDGVSEGQFPKIKDLELRNMRVACQRLGTQPKITCVIVVKRHHTRFFPPAHTGEPDRSNKFNNVPPGTVVDQVIVHPNEIQFFMVSHQSIQGTAKPTRYNVIEDDAKLNIDLLQKLTNNLCHMFPRCNRAVSYPAPAYLAHLVAARGRVYLDGTQRFGELREEYERRRIQTSLMARNPMYFV